VSLVSGKVTAFKKSAKITVRAERQSLNLKGQISPLGSENHAKFIAVLSWAAGQDAGTSCCNAFCLAELVD
jgi:hypothetical protein